MKRAFHSPWLVAITVLALAALPVLAALTAQREQAQRAEALLFERGADVVAAHLRLLTSRQMSWQNGLRMRISNRDDAPELLLNEIFSPRSDMKLLENCRALGYGEIDGEHVVLRWRNVKAGTDIPAAGADLLALADMRSLLHGEMGTRVQMTSVQGGRLLVAAMMVGGATPLHVRGWLIGWWDLADMCKDRELRLVTTDKTLSARPLDDLTLPGERMMEIGEGEAKWRVAVGKGEAFGALFPRVSERAISLTGAVCALLLAGIAGFATRAAGLRAALTAERELVGMKDHLLHSVSHEFRTPLSAILSSTDLLQNYGARLTPERQEEALAQIRQSTAHMNDMVSQVLLLSRIEASRLPIDPRAIDVAVLARELACEVETSTHSHCPIQTNVPDKLSATLDPMLLRAVLGNLLSNAVKFSPKASPVEFTIERTDALRFTIRDHGSGIKAEDLKHVREPFFRALSANDIPGTGLGLTLADKCAGLLGGTLAITSSADGTTATLTL